MTDIFARLLNMSIVGTIAIVMVIFARRFLRNKPKIFSYLLWLPVFFRLICPFSFSSAYSLIGNFSGDTKYIEIPQVSRLDPKMPQVESVVSPYIPAPSPTVSIDRMQMLMFLLAIIWIVGVLLFLGYSFVSYSRIKKQVATATRIRENIYTTDRIESPFVMGMNPKIYIPFGIAETDMPYILAHEQTHIKRLDYLMKPLAYAVVGIHWFNPFVWLAFALMTKDMEMSCDESVLKSMCTQSRKDYSYALLNVSLKSSGSLRPIGFGESNIKSRIQNIIGYKKTGVIALLLAIALCVLVGFFALANPHMAKTKGKELSQILSAYEGSEMVLNDVVKFDYDYVVQFPPYADKKSMNQILDFKCPFLMKSVNEGMMNVLFVKNNKAVCYLYGYGENNQFYFTLPEGEKILKEETGIFSVSREKGYPVYSNVNLNIAYALHSRAKTLLEAKNQYIGNHVADGKIIGLLTWPENVELNGLELQTSFEPYGITVDFITNGDMKPVHEESMDSSIYYRNALIILALIDNCGSVSFRFNESQTVTYTREQAEKNIGYDVRLMTLNNDEFEEFVKYCEGAEDYSDIIEKLDILCMPTERSNVRNILYNREEYDYLLKHGNRAVNYIFGQFKNGVTDDLRSAIMARLVYDILGVRCNVNPDDFATTSEWYQNLKMWEPIPISNYFQYKGNDKRLEAIYADIDRGILSQNKTEDVFVPSIYVVDSIVEDNQTRLFLSVEDVFFKAYQTENGVLLERQGGEIREVAVTLEKNRNGSYTVTKIQSSKDGSDWIPSIKEMCVDFKDSPLTEIYHKMVNTHKEYLEERKKILKKNISQVLDENGIHHFQMWEE